MFSASFWQIQFTFFYQLIMFIWVYMSLKNRATRLEVGQGHQTWYHSYM